MNLGFLRTLHGIINLIQVALGFAALFACSFIWQSTNLYFQFIFKGYGWQTLILAILFVTWVFALIILLSNIFEKDVLGDLGKKKLLLAYGVCLILLIISASLESWYAGKGAGFYHARFIAVTIFNWLLVISYIVLIVLTIFFV